MVVKICVYCFYEIAENLDVTVNLMIINSKYNKLRVRLLHWPFLISNLEDHVLHIPYKYILPLSLFERQKKCCLDKENLLNWISFTVLICIKTLSTLITNSSSLSSVLSYTSFEFSCASYVWRFILLQFVYTLSRLKSSLELYLKSKL